MPERLVRTEYWCKSPNGDCHTNVVLNSRPLSRPPAYVAINNTNALAWPGGEAGQETCITIKRQTKSLLSAIWVIPRLPLASRPNCTITSITLAA